MLAHDLIPALEKAWYTVIWCDKNACDITDSNSINACLEKYIPDFVLNCAAYTAVDDAEDVGAEINSLVNDTWVWFLAKACAESCIWFLTFSTDYVFDGKKTTWYYPWDTTNPINAYWRAKQQWEQSAFENNENSIVVRTSRLYWGGKQFKNFFNTMVMLSEKYDSLKVVDDQYWLPTFTWDLAEYVVHILNQSNTYKGKILHGCNSWKPTTWRWFTKEIMHQLGKKNEVIPCWSDQYPTKAVRPEWSVLLSDDEYSMPDWKEGIRKYISLNNCLN